MDEIIKQRYSELPADMQQAIKSTDLASKFNALAEKHGLRVDQSGALQTETILVMLGLEPTKDYVENIERELSVSRTEALSIADDVNKDIFYSIRNSLRSLQDEEDGAIEEETPAEPPSNLPVGKAISEIEKAGQFTVETPPVSTSSQYKEQGLSKEEVLKGIEDVEPALSMVDHMLASSVTATEKIEIKQEATTPVFSTEPTKKPVPPPVPRTNGIDPYREAI